MNWHILATPRSFCANKGAAHELLETHGCKLDLRAPKHPYCASDLAAMIGDYDGVILGLDDCNAKVIKQAANLKVISRYGVGVDKVALEAAKDKAIKVFNTPNTNTIAVAELCIALIFSLARSVPQISNAAKLGVWERGSGWELNGKCLGLIGLGAIGNAVAQRAQALGMNILAYDPFVVSADTNIQLVSLAEVCARADIISLHTSLNQSTRHIINASSLAQMKKDTYLINTARGELVDENALYDSLVNGHTAGAAMDVFNHEPPKDSPLLNLDNFIATPHMAATTVESVQRMSMAASQNLLDGLSNQENENRII